MYLSFSKPPTEEQGQWSQDLAATLSEYIVCETDLILHTSFPDSPDYVSGWLDATVLVHPMFSVNTNQQGVIVFVDDLLKEFTEVTIFDDEGGAYDSPFCTFGFTNTTSDREPALTIAGRLYDMDISIVVYLHPITSEKPT